MMNKKRNLTKTLLYTSILFLFCIIFTPSGQAFSYQKSNLIFSEPSWIFHSEEKGVKIYYQINSCNNRSVVFFKFNNTNKEKVRISWKETFQTTQVPEEKDGFLGKKELDLPPGETYPLSCDQIKVKECITFSDQALPTYKAEITKVNLRNINVTPL